MPELVEILEQGMAEIRAQLASLDQPKLPPITKLKEQFEWASTKPQTFYPPGVEYSSGGSGPSGADTELTDLVEYNEQFFEDIKIFDKNSLREFFNAGFRGEKRFAHKLLFALVATNVGSSEGAAFIAESLTKVDIKSIESVQAAIVLLHHSFRPAPDWLVALTEAALFDRRIGTEYRFSGIRSLGHCADEERNLCAYLGWSKNPKATSVLMDLAEESNGGRGPIMALGRTGYQSCVPLLVKFLHKAAEYGEPYDIGYGLDDLFSRPVYALGELKAISAVPDLLRYIQYPEVIESLVSIGDRRALPLIEQLVANRGIITDDAGKEVLPDLRKSRLSAARIAAASLGENRIEALGALLDDFSGFIELDRMKTIWCLVDSEDPSVVPFLVKALHQPSEGNVTSQVIFLLRRFKSTAAAEALLDAFAMNFEGKATRSVYSPKMYRENIAESLSEITGQNFWLDVEKWRKWWEANREEFEPARQ